MAMLLTLIVIGAAAWGVKRFFFDEPQQPRPVYQAARAFVSTTLQAIRNWLGFHSNAIYADIIRQHLASGEVTVVSIGLTAYGHQVAQRVWTGPVAPDLNAAFGAAHQFRIHT